MASVPPTSGVAQERHEPKVHVQLLVTVEKRQPWIVGDKIERRFLESAEHENVLDHPGGGLPADLRQLEAVPMKMQRMDVIAGVAELEAVRPP